MWEYYCLENRVSEDDVEKNAVMIELRRNSPSLVEAIEEYTKSVTDPEERRMLDYMVESYRDGKGMRDSTVHGAMVHVGDGGYVKIRHWTPDGLPKEERRKRAAVVREAFDRAHLLTALDNADAMLMTARELYSRAACRIEAATATGESGAN